VGELTDLCPIYLWISRAKFFHWILSEGICRVTRLCIGSLVQRVLQFYVSPAVVCKSWRATLFFHTVAMSFRVRGSKRFVM